jgi:lysozyme family protein
VDNASSPSDSYPPAFAAAVDRVLADEGGLARNPADPGGLTRWGISQREYPGVDVAALTRDGAIAIYYRDWWQRYAFDALAPAIGAKVFDLAVNIGPAHAVKCLQRALRACAHPVDEDGVLGAQTIGAAAAADSAALMAALRSEAAGYYRVTAALWRSARPNADREFLSGWLNRAYE